MDKTVRDLKIGNYIKTILTPMSQKYYAELCEIENLYGTNSSEYKQAQKDYDELWGEREGTLIRIGENFTECKLRNEDNDEIFMFPNIVGNFGQWNETSDISKAKFIIEIEIKD